MLSAYLLDLLFLLIAAVVVVPLFQLTRLGTVPGFLVAGVIVGAAVIIGAVGGVLVVLAVPFFDKLKIDDVVGLRFD